MPAGSLTSATQDIVVRATADLTTPADFENLIIRQEKGRQILFRDIGTAELGPENLRTGNKSNLLYRIGDCVAQRNTHAAIYDALRLCKDF